MTKKWPFGFFVYSDVDKENAAQTEPETAKTVEPAELVKVVWSEPPAAVIAEEEVIEEEVVLEDETANEEPVVTEEAETVEAVQEEPAFTEEDFDDFAGEENTDYADMEEELEVALEEAHQKGLKKQRLFTGISAGVAILGAVGLATGLAIRAHFKKK